MSSYSARLQLPGRTRIPMSVTVDVSGEKLTLSTDDRKIGVWSLGEITVDPKSDGFHIRIDGDEAILTVAEAGRFATELKVDVPASANPTVSAPIGPPAAKSNGVPPDSRVKSLIGGLGQEDELADVRRQINDLRAALTDSAIPPVVVFSKWLALLKLLNRRHGQGAMPTPLFFRLNTELLDLIPVPTVTEPAAVDSVTV